MGKAGGLESTSEYEPAGTDSWKLMAGCCWKLVAGCCWKLVAGCCWKLVDSWKLVLGTEFSKFVEAEAWKVGLGVSWKVFDDWNVPELWKLLLLAGATLELKEVDEEDTDPEPVNDWNQGQSEICAQYLNCTPHVQALSNVNLIQ